MFPPSLQKNIRELDRQISLLETECKNMESEKRETPAKMTSRLSLKEPPSKPHSTATSSSLNSPRRLSSSMPKISPASCAPIRTLCRKPHTPTEPNGSVIGDDGSTPSLSNLTCMDSKKHLGQEDIKGNLTENLTEPDQILHKEVLITNPGEMIEVTVTQKTKSLDAEGRKFPCRRSISSIKEVSESSDDLLLCSKHNTKGMEKKPKDQTWSEILCQQGCTEKWKDRKSPEAVVKTSRKHHQRVVKSSSDEARGLSSNELPENQNEEKANNNEHSTERSLKKRRARSVRTKKKCEVPVVEDVGKDLHEKEIQCMLWREEREKAEFLVNLNNSIRTLHLLIGELKKNSPQDKRYDVLTDMQSTLLKISGMKSTNSLNTCLNLLASLKGEKFRFMEGEDINVMDLKKTFCGVKQFCEELSDEKSFLSNELAEKARTIAALKCKEKEYLSLISNLKFNLEKLKEQVEDGNRSKRELEVVKGKLQEETKVTEALKKSHAKMQDLIENYVLENDRLRTQLRLAQLDSQKYNVLLAGKEVEIKRYKEEMESFQRQISEQLNLLRSKASENEVETALEAIANSKNMFTPTEVGSVPSELTLGKDAFNDPLSSAKSSKASLDSLWTQTHSVPENDLKVRETENRTELVKRSSDSNHDLHGKGKDGGYRSCKSDDSDGEGSGKLEEKYECSLQGVLVNSQRLRGDIGDLLQDMRTKREVVSTQKEDGSKESILSSTDDGSNGCHKG